MRRRAVGLGIVLTTVVSLIAAPAQANTSVGIFSETNGKASNSVTLSLAAGQVEPGDELVLLASGEGAGATSPTVDDSNLTSCGGVGSRNPSALCWHKTAPDRGPFSVTVSLSGGVVEAFLYDLTGAAFSFDQGYTAQGGTGSTQGSITQTPGEASGVALALVGLGSTGATFACPDTQVSGWCSPLTTQSNGDSNPISTVGYKVFSSQSSITAKVGWSPAKSYAMGLWFFRAVQDGPFLMDWENGTTGTLLCTSGAGTIQIWPNSSEPGGTGSPLFGTTNGAVSSTVASPAGGAGSVGLVCGGKTDVQKPTMLEGTNGNPPGYTYNLNNDSAGYDVRATFAFGIVPPGDEGEITTGLGLMKAYDGTNSFFEELACNKSDAMTFQNQLYDANSSPPKLVDVFQETSIRTRTGTTNSPYTKVYDASGNVVQNCATNTLYTVEEQEQVIANGSTTTFPNGDTFTCATVSGNTNDCIRFMLRAYLAGTTAPGWNDTIVGSITYAAWKVPNDNGSQSTWETGGIGVKGNTVYTCAAHGYTYANCVGHYVDDIAIARL